MFILNLIFCHFLNQETDARFGSNYFKVKAEIEPSIQSASAVFIWAWGSGVLSLHRARDPHLYTFRTQHHLHTSLAAQPEGLLTYPGERVASDGLQWSRVLQDGCRLRCSLCDTVKWKIPGSGGIGHAEKWWPRCLQAQVFNSRVQ